MTTPSERLFVKRWQDIAIDAADALVIIAPAVIPEAVVVIEGDMIAGAELGGDFVEVVGGRLALAAGGFSRHHARQCRGNRP